MSFEWFQATAEGGHIPGAHFLVGEGNGEQRVEWQAIRHRGGVSLVLLGCGYGGREKNDGLKEVEGHDYQGAFRGRDRSSWD